MVNSKWTNEAVNIIVEFKDELKKESEVTADRAKDILNQVLEKNGVKIGKMLQALRVAITGAGSGPDLMQIIEVLGVKETVSRIDSALQVLSEHVKA